MPVYKHMDTETLERKVSRSEGSVSVNIGGLKLQSNILGKSQEKNKYSKYKAETISLA